MSGVNPARLAAIKALHEIIGEGAFSNEVLESSADFARLNQQERAFATALVYGTLNRKISIDKIIADHSSRPIEKIDPLVMNILRLGVWQLVYAYAVPEFAAVDESVKLTRALGRKSSSGFVNGILRNIKPEEIAWRTKDKGIELGLGNELFGMFKKWYGSEIAEDIGNYFLRDDFDISIRLNPTKISKKSLKESLIEEGVLVEDGNYFPNALRIKVQDKRLNELRAFQDGLFMVQEEAAQSVGHISGAEQAGILVDLCSAPGGKSCDLAERMPEGAKLLAMDINEDRLQLAKDNAQRLGLAMDFFVADASSDDYQALLKDKFPWLEDGADLILLDVPCSGLGLLARKPELRWRMGYEDIQRFPPLQKKMLELASKLLKPEGRLVYSTCTLNPEENQNLVRNFLSSELGQAFELEKLREKLPHKLVTYLDQDDQTKALLNEGFVLFRPDLVGGDGFFISSLVYKEIKGSQ